MRKKKWIFYTFYKYRRSRSDCRRFYIHFLYTRENSNIHIRQIYMILNQTRIMNVKPLKSPYRLNHYYLIYVIRFEFDHRHPNQMKLTHINMVSSPTYYIKCRWSSYRIAQHSNTTNCILASDWLAKSTVKTNKTICLVNTIHTINKTQTYTETIHINMIRNIQPPVYSI